jgi:hypothetical protein
VPAEDGQPTDDADKATLHDNHLHSTKVTINDDVERELPNCP